MSGHIPPPPERREIWAHMREPVFASVALLCFLAVNVVLGQLMPSRTASLIVVGLTVCMIVTVLLFSMEVRKEPPLMRFYAILGFFWLAILLFITMLDYWTR